MLQFGEGNFLRAFVDWLVDRSNKAGLTDIGIAICKPRPTTHSPSVIEQLQEQDNLFHVWLQGIENGEEKSTIELIESVMESFDPHQDYATYHKHILSPDLRFIVSNTTEAGISYIEGDDITAEPPLSFPAKMTALLHQRYEHFAGDQTKGLFIVCCELIEDNSSTLKKYIIQHAQHNNLSEEFISWVEESCHFCDTLVDRIVSGYPTDSSEEIEAEIGYTDKLIVKGELYHLWAIGGERYRLLQEELPLDKAGLNVLYMPSIKEFRDKKVRVLNGSHTAMVPISIQVGCTTVEEAFDNPAIERFISQMMSHEVLPMIDGSEEENKHFADGILERFYNPHIKHMLASIALNSLSKWEARNYPTLLDYWLKRGEIAHYESFAFAALITLYTQCPDFTPNDTAEHIAHIKRVWNANELEHSIEQIIAKDVIFTVDIEQITPFAKVVASYIEDIIELGATQALDKFLASQG